MISHKHKTIFVHIPKCGGTSIEMMYLEDLGLTYDCRAPLILYPNDRKELGPPRLAHLRAEEFTKYHYISDELFNYYYKFAVVRNPFKRITSFYKYLGYSKVMPLTQFIHKELKSAFRRTDGIYWFCRPQVDFICGSKEGDVLVDDVIRLEEIDKHIHMISERTGIDGSQLKHVNKSSGVPFFHSVIRTTKLVFSGSFSMNPFFDRQQTLNKNDISIIKELYQKDFQLLDYDDKNF